MLLTLAVNSIKTLLDARAIDVSDLHELPVYCRDHLELRGLNVPASLLAGWSGRDLDRLRDRADKCHCPCLVLVDETPLPLAAARDKEVDDALDRIDRLIRAAHRLGSNSIAVSILADDTDEAFENAIAGCKNAMEVAERHEINLLLAPGRGLTEDPERLTDLIKKIGGFRIGTMPDFLGGVASGDAMRYLRRLTPYAGVVNASFGDDNDHLGEHVEAVLSVGFSGAISVDYRGTGPCDEAIRCGRDALWSAIEEADGKASR
jgi:sugar phosphate isomerase/epimerase